MKNSKSWNLHTLIEYYFNSLLGKSNPSNFEGIKLESLVYFPLVSEIIQNKEAPLREIEAAISLSTVIKIDKQNNAVVHHSRETLIKKLTIEEKIELQLTHIFRPIIFFYDIPLRSIYQNFGKIKITQLITTKKLEFSESEVLKFFQAKYKQLNVKLIDNKYLQLLFDFPVPRKILTSKSEDFDTSFDSLNPSSPVIDRQFTVMSYNILAESFSRQQENWISRRETINSEILFYAPDILLLQEVQMSSQDNHLDFFDSNFGKQGYHGMCLSSFVYLSAAPKLGICIYWKSELFQEIDSEKIYFPEYLQNFSKDIQTRYNSHHCALIVALRSKFTNQIIIVCTTHIWCNFTAPDTQIVQVGICLQKIAQMKAKYPNSSVIFGGDFNSQPQSGVYQLIGEGKLEISHSDLSFPRIHGYQLPIKLTHDISLSSSYKAVMEEEPKYTNKQASFEGTLDYIWYSNKSLRVCGVIEMPVLKAPVPDQYYPSDHLSLIAKFYFTNDNSNSKQFFINNETSSESETDSDNHSDNSSNSDSDSDSDLGMELELNIF